MASINPNTYVLYTAALLTALSALSSTYTGMVLERRVFKADDLPAFDRYLVIVSPNGNPWDEEPTRIARNVTYVHRADLFLLVKAFHVEHSLWGTTAPSLGLFQLIEDAKDLLRGSTLGGLTPPHLKTYRETGRPVDFESRAVGGAFDAGPKVFVHRARLVHETPLDSFCVNRVAEGA